MGFHHDALEDILRQIFRPAFEQLQDLGARLRLHDEVPGGRIDQNVQKGVQLLRVIVSEGPGRLAIGASPLDHIGGDGPGPARETNQRLLRIKLRADARQGLSDRGKPARRGLNLVRQGGDLRQDAQPRSLAGLEPDILTQGARDQQDVRKDNSGVQWKPSDGLECRFRRHLGVVAEGDEVPGPAT